MKFDDFKDKMKNSILSFIGLSIIIALFGLTLMLAIDLWTSSPMTKGINNFKIAQEVMNNQSKDLKKSETVHNITIDNLNNKGRKG